MAVEAITTVLDRARRPWDPEPEEGVRPPSRYDLTTLAAVKEELSVDPTNTSDDNWFSRAISQASAAISNYCNRVFQLEAVQDQIYIQQDPYPWQVPGGVFPLQLRRWPLQFWQPVSLTGNTHSSISIDGIANTAGLCPNSLIFASDGSIPAGARAKSVSPYSITLDQPATSSETGLSISSGVQVIQTLALGVTQTLVYGTDFSIDAERGWLIRLDKWTGVAVRWEAVPTTVQYQGGYLKIPDDLVEATLRLVTARKQSRGRDPFLVERNQPDRIGMQRWWVGSAKGQVGVLPPDVVGLVDPYRVPVTA